MKKHIFSILSMAALAGFFISASMIESESLIPFGVCAASLALFGLFAKMYEILDGDEH